MRFIRNLLLAVASAITGLLIGFVGLMLVDDILNMPYPIDIILMLLFSTVLCLFSWLFLGLLKDFENE